MNLTTWTLVALLIAVVGCLVNIVILIRHVNRLEKNANINQDQAMNDIAVLFSGMKANCFGRKAGTDKKFVESLHRINERVRKND